MKPNAARWLACRATLGLAACGRPDAPDAWLGAVMPVDNPAGPGSRYPHLAVGGHVAMSWLQALPQGGFALQHARLHEGAWGPAATVTTGDDWFIIWADFPSVVPLDATTWAAHWLQQKPGRVYSYDVRIAVSRDGGKSWSAPMSPHDDGTPTEHGFVTLFAAGDAMQAVWLDGRHTGGGHAHAAGAAGAMTVRGAIVGADGRRTGTDVEIDACPVNGPAVDALGRTVVVAWFAAPDVPRIRLAFSQDAGRTFGPPVEVASGDVAGRVDVVVLDDGRAIVSWLQPSAGGAEIRAQPFGRDGPAGPPVVIASSPVQRASGFPQMVRAGGGLLFAWTDAAEPAQVRTAHATLR